MKGTTRLIRYAVLLVLIGVVYWQRGSLPLKGTGSDSETPREKGTAVLKDGPIPGIEVPNPATGQDAPAASKATKVGAYDRFPDARLVDREGNDGDSFLVRAGGREFELRLYFVDAPESYLSDRYADQRRRVAEQARELGGITPEEAIEVGKRATAFVKQQLAGRPFTVYTYWEQVFDGDRYYGFVELPDGGDLGTRLVENGLARIHTKGPGSKEKPVPTPKGESFFAARDELRALEQEARKAKRGAWAY